jgi:hypothetical protein
MRSLRQLLSCLILVALPIMTLAHSTHHPQHGLYTTAEVAWMKRQKAVDNTWCCGPENVTMVEDPQIRVVADNGRSHYEVHLLEQWVRVPPGRMFQENPNDPSPFEKALVFFSSERDGRMIIWCFRTVTRG